MNEPLLEAQHIIKRNEWAYDEVIDTFNNAEVTFAHKEICNELFSITFSCLWSNIYLQL